MYLRVLGKKLIVEGSVDINFEKIVWILSIFLKFVLFVRIILVFDEKKNIFL